MTKEKISPIIDIEKTIEFCKIYPNFIHSSIQVFDDNQKDPNESLAQIFSIRKWWIDEVIKKQEKWCWVYFSVNQMETWTRSKSTTTHINAWIVEVDDKPKKEQMDAYMNAPIKPSMIIESKKSYHVYYFAKDWDIETYETICWWLKQYFGWDIALVKDYSRVLRIPWFSHLKDPLDPFLVKLVYINNENKHTKEQMMSAFPYENVEKKTWTQTIIPSEWVWNEMASWNSQSMLDDLSWTRLMNWDMIAFKSNTVWSQILVNWKSTWSWVDAAWMIWSTDKWWPTRIQWILRYWNVTKSELLSFCLDKYENRFDKQMLQREKTKVKAESVKKQEDMAIEWVFENFQHVSYKEKILRSVSELDQTNPREIIKRWWDERDKSLWWIYTGKVYLIGWETWGGKSTFINLVCENIVKQWHGVVRYSLEDRLEDKWKEDLFFAVNRYRKNKWYTMYKRSDFVNNEYWHEEWKFTDSKFKESVDWAVEVLSKYNITELDRKKQVNITELCELIKEEAQKWKRFFAVDHLHYFEMSNSERRDLEIQSVMHKINDLARDYNICIFLIAHYSNTKQIAWEPHPWMFKDGSAIKQVANIIIQMVTDDYDWSTDFHITKIRWPWRCYKISWRFDIDKFEYNFIKSSEQREKEKDVNFNIWKNYDEDDLWEPF